MDTAVRTAQRREPVPADYQELLHAIPANGRPARRVPDGTEPVGALCAGAVSTAERLRHLARTLPGDAAWSPAMTVTSLRRAAGANMVTSHHCSVLLRTLAACAAPSCPGDVSAAMVRSEERRVGKECRS